jgi:hypothetical protein
MSGQTSKWMSGLAWVLLSPFFFLMALIATPSLAVESLTGYYVQVAVVGAWAACGVVAGILFWIACAYYCVSATIVLILVLFHPELWGFELFLALGVLLTGYTLLYIVRRRKMREDRGLP